ncbi:MAG: hypothetical protein AMJ41_01260 [candidate division Zixibacteria bacterium DG_27]|nr:MAG: hypothetical protein AMJ41_01260 [candidate division Zixibacteria bacterium DG_27]
MRRRLPVIVCFLFGLFMLVQFFVPHPVGTEAYETVLDWVQIIYVFALFVGVAGIIKLHGSKLSPGKKGWFYSLTTILGLAAMVILGFVFGVGKGTPFNWIFQNLQAPMQATMFSLLAFFIASAAYRGFRVRNVESVLLLGAAVIVMIGRVPIGKMIFPYSPEVADWILRVPSMAARRGIFIGIGLGSIATALRVIVGIERTYLGRD